MREFRAGAPASVVAVASLLSATAMFGLAISGDAPSALLAAAATLASAHATANRLAAEKALQALRSALDVSWRLTTEVVAASTRATLAEQRAKGSFNPVPEVANDGR